jgi:osmotically-inducible protein OsmY
LYIVTIEKKKGVVEMRIYDTVTNEVYEALLSDERTADAPIDVINQQGIVTLTGEVKSNQVAQAAEEIAKRQNGVIKVVNELRFS